MRNALPAFLLILIALCGCKKEPDSTEPDPPAPASFRVAGLVDFTMRKTFSGKAQSHQMPVAIEHNNGDQERVTLSLEDVPPGLKDSIFITTGYPTFSTTLQFIDSNAADGSHTLKLVAQGERSGRREFPFKVIVEPVPDCAVGLLGNWTGRNNCLLFSPSFTTTVQLTSVRNQITFFNLDGNGQMLSAILTCNGPTYITIPSQTINGIAYSGNGSFTTAGGIRLYISKSGTPGNCSFDLVR